MVDDAELIKSIKKKLKSGYPDGELKNELLAKGYAADDIERLFFIASGHSNDRGKEKVGQSSYVTMFNLIGMGLLITGIAVIGTNIWLKEYGIYLLIASGLCFVLGFSKKRNL